jgi:hypothetical protein
MPKDLKPFNTKNKFIYHSQSLKKTHCNKTIINKNITTSKIIIDKPENHWTNQEGHTNWEYYSYIANQLVFATREFIITKNWTQWEQLQKNHHLLRVLVEESTVLLPYSPEEVKNLNETFIKNVQKTSPVGKAIQVSKQV